VSDAYWLLEGWALEVRLGSRVITKEYTDTVFAAITTSAKVLACQRKEKQLKLTRFLLQYSTNASGKHGSLFKVSQSIPKLSLTKAKRHP
jgi:hypothetical protein